MSYYVLFGADANDPIEGDDVASLTGWATFGGWILDHADLFPEAAYLIHHGQLHAADGDERDVLAALEAELKLAIRDKPGSPQASVVGVAQRLLDCVRKRPPGTWWLGVTDGTEGEDEGDDDEGE